MDACIILGLNQNGEQEESVRVSSRVDAALDCPGRVKMLEQPRLDRSGSLRRLSRIEKCRLGETPCRRQEASDYQPVHQSKRNPPCSREMDPAGSPTPMVVTNAERRVMNRPPKQWYGRRVVSNSSMADVSSMASNSHFSSLCCAFLRHLGVLFLESEAFDSKFPGQQVRVKPHSLNSANTQTCTW